MQWWTFWKSAVRPPSRPSSRCISPEWSIAVKRLRQQLGDHPREFALPARAWNRPAVQVVAQVEARIVLPSRVAEGERDRDSALRVAMKRRQPRLDVSVECIQRERTVEYRDATDVEERVLALEIEEARVA